MPSTTSHGECENRGWADHEFSLFAETLCGISLDHIKLRRHWEQGRLCSMVLPGSVFRYNPVYVVRDYAWIGPRKQHCSSGVQFELYLMLPSSESFLWFVGSKR